MFNKAGGAECCSCIPRQTGNRKCVMDRKVQSELVQILMQLKGVWGGGPAGYLNPG